MQRTLMASASFFVLALAAPALAQEAAGGLVDELIVTAQKREESIQDVPIAVSAYGEDALRAQRIDGVGNLVNSVPNLTFQRRSLRTNFQIRGVGAQLIASTGDDGVGVHLNNAPLTANRIADAEFFDVQRVEVLRGPQGTLYGRNATGGVVNVITNKPGHDFAASVTAEVANYDTIRAQGFVNLPIGDMFAVRLAAFGLDRAGYTKNTLNDQRLDGRQIWAGRATVAFEPSSTFRATALWEGFAEDDTRGARKALCKRDPGLASVGGVATGVAQAALSQGCLPASVYDDDVYDATNLLATFPGILGRQIGLWSADPNAGGSVSRNLREVEVTGRPIYRPRTDIYQLELAWDATPGLTLTSLTSYTENENYSRGDSSGLRTPTPFGVTRFTPTGTLTDGQFGVTDRFEAASGGAGHNEQWTQELRVQSDFEGPINFNVGGIYIDYSSSSTTYSASNVTTLAARTLAPTAYVDPLADPDFTGHNYFISLTEYDLTSKALFGELYWQATETLRVTGGLRYTDDKKKTRGSGATLLAPGRGPIFGAEQRVRFKETTGRLNIDWSPDLSFTDSTLVYASYSKGYKGGGFNPPGVVALGLRESFQPEFVNAYEIGTKNTLLDGTLILNLTGFYYDYKGYQIARSVNRSIYNENIDATIKGVELESVWEPVRNLRLNANIGYLDTRIDEGRVVDTFNRTRGDTRYIYANATTGGCILNAEGVANLLRNPAGAAVLAGVACSGPATMLARLTAAGVAPATASALTNGVYAYDPNVTRYSTGAGEGVIQDLEGNKLPGAPKWTVALGAQYSWELPGGWGATLRGDYYRQSESFMRYNNNPFDRIRSWENVNATLNFERAEANLRVQLFAKNLLDDDTIVGFDIADENLGALRNVILLEPRTYGVSITKGF